METKHSEVDEMTTAQAAPQMTLLTLTGDGVNQVMDGLVSDFDGEVKKSVYEVEIENRLRSLEQESVSVDGMDCRSCFQGSGNGQVKIRMRLKQVTGSVSG
jgi:hypothetical protein